MSPAKEHLKVHRRSVTLDGLNYTILSPRPSSSARFATNRFHEGWHVLTDTEGAQLLARLCWAMAFQRRSRTVIVIDAPFVVPNPINADPSSPIAIVNSDLETLSSAAVASLRTELPLRAESDGTVVLQTRGLDVALADPKAFAERDDQAQWRGHRERSWLEGSAGLLVLAAPAAVLRAWGVELSELGPRSAEGPGEVQVLDAFSSRVEQAIAARSQLFPDKER